MPATHLGEPPPRVPPLLSAAEEAAARTAFAEAMEASAQADLSVDGMPLELAQKWAALRDCVALGREHKCARVHAACARGANPPFPVRPGRTATLR